MFMAILNFGFIYINVLISTVNHRGDFGSSLFGDLLAVESALEIVLGCHLMSLICQQCEVILGPELLILL